MGGKYLLGGFL